MTQQAPKDEELEKEKTTNEEEEGEVEIAPDRADYFTWKPGDLVFEEHVWDVSFQDPEGNLYLVTGLEDFIRYLQIAELTLTEFMHFDVAEYMPADLKAAIEERIGNKIEYLGRNLPKDQKPLTMRSWEASNLPKDQQLPAYEKIPNEEKLTGDETPAPEK